MDDLTITSVTVEPLNLGLATPFAISLGTQYEAKNVLVTVETAAGITGVGEAAPIATITGETQETTLAACRVAAALIEGRRVSDYRGIAHELRANLSSQYSARAGVEMAVLDALYKIHGVPLSEFYGGANVVVETDYTIGIDAPEVAREKTQRASGAGFSDLKIKVGADVTSDIERVRVVAEAAPNARVKVDANQGYTVKEAIQFVSGLEREGLSLALLEQPVARHDIPALKAVRDAVSVPVAADESVFTPEEAMRVVRAEAADIINLKLMKGGLIGARDIIAIAEAAGVGLMIGCMLESSIGIQAAAHVVAGSGAFSFVDLDGHLLLSDDVLDLPFSPQLRPSGPGIGIELQVVREVLLI